MIVNRCAELKVLLSSKETLVTNDLKKLGVARVSLPTIAICASIKGLLQAMEALKSGVFTGLVHQGRLCSAQDIGRLIAA